MPSAQTTREPQNAPRRTTRARLPTSSPTARASRDVHIHSQAAGMGASQNEGYLVLGARYSTDYKLLGSMGGPPYFGKLPSAGTNYKAGAQGFGICK